MYRVGDRLFQNNYTTILLEETEREREKGRVSSVLLSIDLKNCDAIAATEETVWCFRDIRACREMLRVLKAPFVRARWKDGGTEDLLT